MSKFIPRSYEQILAQGIAKMVSRSTLNDVGDAASMKHLLAASARQDAQQYFQMSLLLDLFSIDTATGDDLDERAKDIQPALISRFVAFKSTGLAVFSRNGTSGTVTIPAGTKVSTSDGKVFVTTIAGTITAVSVEQIAGHGVGRDSNQVSTVAEQPGSAGNVAADTIVKFSAKPAGVDEVTNPSLFLNGRDKETDDSFRARLKAFIASLPRCTIQAIESNLIGKQDPDTGATILYVNVFEDQVNRGAIIGYVDDGTGTAEAVDTIDVALTGNYTWNSTLTVATDDTSDVVAGDFIKLDSDGILFEVASLVVDTSVTIDNPSAEAIPTGAGPTSKSGENVTQALAGPPPDTAVGGEEVLFLNNKPIKGAEPFVLASSTRGILVRDTDFRLNEATGQLDFITPLSAGEKIMADYTYYVGLISFAQKLVDGDLTDPVNYPGLRAAGVYAQVLTPQVLLQNVVVVLTVLEGFDQDEVRANVVQAIKDYINTRSISNDVIRNELIKRIQGIAGVYNSVITTPTADVIILDDQLARTSDPNIVIS